jgi:hypothetical protein
VLPDSDHEPPSPSKKPIGALVAFAVARDLRRPPAGVRFESRRMSWAPVPEAAIEEHGDLRSPENEIGPTSPVRLRATVHQVAKTQPVNGGSEGQLPCGIAPRLPLHPATNLPRRSGRSVYLFAFAQIRRVFAGGRAALESNRIP